MSGFLSPPQGGSEEEEPQVSVGKSRSRPEDIDVGNSRFLPIDDDIAWTAGSSGNGTMCRFQHCRAGRGRASAAGWARVRAG